MKIMFKIVLKLTVLFYFRGNSVVNDQKHPLLEVYFFLQNYTDFLIFEMPVYEPMF